MTETDGVSKEGGTEFHRRKTAIERLWYWKLAIMLAMGKSMAAVIVAMLNTLNEKSWNDFSTTGKWCAAGGAIIAGWQVLEAFLNTTMSTLKQNDPEKSK